MGGDVSADRAMHDGPGRAANVLCVVGAVLTVAMGALVISNWSSGFGSWWGSTVRAILRSPAPGSMEETPSRSPASSTRRWRSS